MNILNEITTDEDAAIALDSVSREGEWEINGFYPDEDGTLILAKKNFDWGYGYDASESFADASQFQSLSDCQALYNKLAEEAYEEAAKAFASIENPDIIIDLNFEPTDLAFFFGVGA